MTGAFAQAFQAELIPAKRDGFLDLVYVGGAKKYYNDKRAAMYRQKVLEKADEDDPRVKEFSELEHLDETLNPKNWQSEEAYHLFCEEKEDG